VTRCCRPTPCGVKFQRRGHQPRAAGCFDNSVAIIGKALTYIAGKEVEVAERLTAQSGCPYAAPNRLGVASDPVEPAPAITSQQHCVISRLQPMWYLACRQLLDAHRTPLSFGLP
jgi:hypothetical protein